MSVPFTNVAIDNKSQAAEKTGCKGSKGNDINFKREVVIAKS
jgi:hypothetical protein